MAACAINHSLPSQLGEYIPNKDICYPSALIFWAQGWTSDMSIDQTLSPGFFPLGSDSPSNSLSPKGKIRDQSY